jgi:excisionase family DNA binding protein
MELGPYIGLLPGVVGGSAWDARELALNPTLQQGGTRLQINHRRIELNDLLHAVGAPLTTSEFARMVGMSSTFIRTEIKSGELRAVRLGRGRKPVFRILIHDAVRYARKLGLL